MLCSAAPSISSSTTSRKRLYCNQASTSALFAMDYINRDLIDVHVRIDSSIVEINGEEILSTDHDSNTPCVCTNRLTSGIKWASASHLYFYLFYFLCDVFSFLIGHNSERLDIDHPQHTCVYCRALFWKAKCLKNNLKNTELVYPLYCKKGRIKLPLLADPPLYLAYLMNPQSSPINEKFKENIYLYNSLFAFTSMGGRINHDINKSCYWAFTACWRTKDEICSVICIRYRKWVAK